MGWRFRPRLGWFVWTPGRRPRLLGSLASLLLVFAVLAVWLITLPRP
jgi:hypothetical protein